MYKALFTGSPHLWLPLLALFIFAAVFLSVVIRTMIKKPASYAPLSNLPLEDEESHDDRQA